jgi:uncharacterized protein YdhG (YjbR/CyaY superfamily)
MKAKKAKAGSAKSARKAKGPAKTPVKTMDEYLAGVPEPARSTLGKIRAAIRSAAPREAVEVISYGIPAFRHKEVLIWFAAFSGHCSLFPTAAVIAEFKGELKEFSISRGTIQFPVNQPLPLPLVKKMVKSRVARIAAKTKQS